MLTRRHSIEDKRPLSHGDHLHGWLGPDGAARLAMLAGDVTLVVDAKGQILDGSANTDQFPEFDQWIGSDWLELVTVESRAKVLELLSAARNKGTQQWRQVNHMSPGGDIPVRYALLGTSDKDRFIAVGRDLREAAALQQRILQAQQSLERDYSRLRQVEKRFRMLFELSSQPVLVVEVNNNRIREANPAAHRLLGVGAGSLAGSRLPSLFSRDSRDKVLAHIGSALSARSVAPVNVELAKDAAKVVLSATGFVQQGEQYLLLRLSDAGQGDPSLRAPTESIIAQMPDALVIADRDMIISSANIAFVELVQAASEDQLRGVPLAEFVGRPGIDLEAIAKQIESDGFARNVSTIIRSDETGFDEPVELSAVRTSGEAPYYGFLIRPIGRRMRDLPPAHEDLPRSVEQLTDLVGRMSLKDIVRESTDLIERLCIEAALSYTNDNRASAAEILGLSRQSLYSKLHRYGLTSRADSTADTSAAKDN